MSDTGTPVDPAATPSDSSGQPWILISRNHLLHSKMSISHAMSVLGPGATEAQAKTMLNKLEEQKKILNGYVRMALKKRMVERAVQLKMKIADQPVRSFDDIHRSWRIDGSVENAERVFQVMYGNFDSDPTWLEQLEANYMADFRWRYKEDGTHRPCVQLLITRVRNEMIKSINRAGLGTHGRYLKVARDSEWINEKNRYRKRVKGTFHMSFIRDTKFDTEDEETEGNHDDMVDVNDNLSINPQQELEQRNRNAMATKRQVKTAHMTAETVKRVRIVESDNRELRQAMTNIEQDIQKETEQEQRRHDQQEIAKKKPAKKKKAPTSNDEHRQRLDHDKLRHNNRSKERDRPTPMVSAVARGKKKASSVDSEELEDSMSGEKSDNSSDGLDDGLDNDEESDDEFIQEIVGHDIKKGEAHLQVKWGTGHISWEPIKPVRKDVKKMVEEYVGAHNLGHPYKISRSVKKKTVGKNVACKESSDSNAINKKCNNDHSRYEAGVTFKEEATAAYWKPGQQMYGVDCAKCGAKIVGDASDCGGQDMWFKPSILRPVMTCTNRETKGCRIVICHPCFQKGVQQMMDQDKNQGRRSVRRPAG